MSDYNDKLIEDHEYDGIQEFDNPMPGWWKGLWLLSIIFSVVYVFGFGWEYIPSYGVDLRDGMSQLETQRQAFADKQPPITVTNEVLVLAMVDKKAIANGAKSYKSYCASCHGDLGQGGIGPNLTDVHWIHGGEPQKVFSTIKTGTANGMPSWSATLRPIEMVQIVGFIHTLQQTKPAGAKEAQGEPFKPGMGVTAKSLKDAEAKLAESAKKGN